MNLRSLPRVSLIVGGVVGFALGFEPIWAGQPIWDGQVLFSVYHKWVLIAIVVTLAGVTWSTRQALFGTHYASGSRARTVGISLVELLVMGSFLVFAFPTANWEVPWTWPAIIVSLGTACGAIWQTLRQRGPDGWLPQHHTVLGFAGGLGVFGFLGFLTSLWWITYFVPQKALYYVGGTWAAVAWPFWHHLLPGAIFLVFWVSAVAQILTSHRHEPRAMRSTQQAANSPMP